MTSEIRANTLKSRVGLGTVSFTNTGPIVSGIVTANSFSGPISGTTGTFSGNVDINGDLDVDGHTNLDNVSIAGITTITKGLVMTAGTSNLYLINGALSYYAADNAVYLNGAGDSGILRLNATGTYNDRTSINIYGKDVSNHQDTITFKTVSQERLRIDSSGRLLYGKTSSTRETSLVIVGNSNNYATNPGTIQLEMGNTPSNLASLGQIQFGCQDKVGATISGRADQDWNINSAHGTHIRFMTTANSSASNPTERLRITSGGAVGINETAPAAQLHVENNNANASTYYLNNMC